MTKEEHIQRHKELHNKLDELVADFILHTTNLPSRTTLLEFMKWSFNETQNPTMIGEYDESTPEGSSGYDGQDSADSSKKDGGGD